MNLDRVKTYIESELPKQHFDSCAVASIDFKNGDISAYESSPFSSSLYYDLASLTKPLTLAATFLKLEELFNDDMKLLLNHQAGLPIGGRLDQKSWKEQILSYKISKSKTSYSDYSALRLQLELEKCSSKSLFELISSYYDEQLVHWKLNPGPSPFTGQRNGSLIQGVVHDDNALMLDSFTSHAGLFGTIRGVSQTLLNMDKADFLLTKMNKAFEHNLDGRFLNGWDRVEDQHKTLAGSGASLRTFGHLGFTGTAMWIDCTREQGYIFLSNATQNYWYSRNGLNKMRRDIGNLVWN